MKTSLQNAKGYESVGHSPTKQMRSASGLPSGSGESSNSYALTNAQRVTSSLRNWPPSVARENINVAKTFNRPFH